LVPALSKYKVYIIDEVHMLSIGAFNALLKTLEEPPAHVIFILATTDPQKIPITVISRCQRFDFQQLNVETISNYLLKICESEKIKATKEATEKLLT
jgi:DNA polymerase-3 subunit gamma/tau